MKRIVMGGVLVASLVLLRPISAPLAEEKPPSGWKVVGDFKALKLWETELGPHWPQITLLQLSSERLKELQSDQLAFYTKYNIFGPTPCDNAVGHFVVRLVAPKTQSKDPAIVVAAHDSDTYCASAAFEVSDIK